MVQPAIQNVWTGAVGLILKEERKQRVRWCSIYPTCIGKGIHSNINNASEAIKK